MRPSLSIAILIAVGVVVAVAVSSPRDLNVPTEATPSNSPLAGGGSETEEDVSTPLTEINPSGSPEAPITLNDLIPVGPPSQWVIEGVPYIAETPDGVWTGPWKNACEEASIAMVEFFYSGKVTVTKDEAKTYMSNLFEIEDRLWGQNANSDAAQTTELINGYTAFRATVIDNPTIETIKEELRAGRPVIAPLNGFELGNRNILFLPTGSGYHMLVIVGYNDITDVFIVQDDGDEKTGEHHRYRYDTFMESLHDYNDEEKKTNGPARVLFTRPVSVP